MQQLKETFDDFNEKSPLLDKEKEEGKSKLQKDTRTGEVERVEDLFTDEW